MRGFRSRVHRDIPAMFADRLPGIDSMTPSELLFLILLFQLKHFLADFAWQSGWMVANKGTYGHPGGIAHAGVHAALTVVVLLTAPVPVVTVIAIALGEWVLHYHIDYAKSQLNRRAGLTPSDKSYWTLSGADQAAHQLTYLLILWLIIH
jgi:hypothetical protein